MKARANTLFSLGLAAGLAMLTFWLQHIVDTPSGTPSDQQRQEPDFIVDGVRATDLNRDGRAESMLTARSMRHFADNDTTEFDEPRLVRWREDGPPVHVAADRGKTFKDNDEVRLYGNVVVRREATPERPELRLETTYLEVFPKADVARTPEQVFLYEGGSRLSGVGMEYDNKTRQLELKSRVSGSLKRDER